MRKIHIALGVSNIARSVKDYSRRLGRKPVLVIPGEYALWQTPQVNFSIRQVDQGSDSLRHLGWEDSTAKRFSKSTDCNGLVWELFNASLQMREIRQIWPKVKRTDVRRKSRPATTKKRSA